MPNRDVWQHAIRDLGFPAELDESFDPCSDAGFMPATYKGQSAGFEFDLGSARDVLANYSHIVADVANRDKCATFRWGGDIVECAAALSAAAALTKLTDGIYFYPDDDILYDGNAAIEATRAELSSI